MARPAPWTVEEGQAKADGASETRQAQVSVDIRAFAAVKDRAKNVQLTAIDKWRLFKSAVKTGVCGSEAWHVRRLLFEMDSATVHGQHPIHSGITTLCADIIGLSLDRGPASVQHCRAEGNALTQAALNQMASFTIISCNKSGVRFQDGGDTFVVSVRFAGLGRQSVRAKIADK